MSKTEEFMVIRLILLEVADCLLNEFQSVSLKCLTLTVAADPVNICLQGWEAPPQEVAKLNSDASVRPGDDFVSIGVLLRDHDGVDFGACSKRISGYLTVELAELLALKEGILFICLPFLFHLL
ncbi:hypothetical protein PanWU01x14_020250 [Parasponia andersonii]|uniref:Uncharacterized protein n=1 Tax=Parasponia andersonii TaxID=3476 RepID=A0A2P5DYP0_PARAD|nr:hypothetical protein PanWU01x14_020250 [Parasponia andersonii]